MQQSSRTNTSTNIKYKIQQSFHIAIRSAIQQNTHTIEKNINGSKK